MKKTITIRVDKALMDKVEKAAKEDDRTTNNMIVQILKFWANATKKSTK